MYRNKITIKQLTTAVDSEGIEQKTESVFCTKGAAVEHRNPSEKWADGRMKPDVVAPGHKIWSSVPSGEMVVLDGTSMAAPHVSGICALIMGRHQELTGEPERIKKILMETATDLGRERRFQGAGLVDALRALQAV